MNIVIIDGQGGRMGSLLTARIKKENIPHCHLLAIGTNATATAAMLKAGADNGATGENPVIVACRNADFIIGPLGILAADSLFGEITPAMAIAVGQSQAQKILLPVNKCSNHVVGVADLTMTELVERALECLKDFLES
ncbi:MAG: DUF3842 family protein [Lachnospiraceae bacterium]|nr:DUF3842 family protein [Lachnospiraceae bacterium]